MASILCYNLVMNFLKRIFSNKPDTNLIQFLRYGVSSGIAFLVDFLIITVLTMIGVNVFISNVFSFLSGLAVVYYFSVVWVFTGTKRANKKIEFLIFAAVGIAALGVNELILFIFYKKVGIHPLISKVIAAGVTVIFNYILRKTILYSKKSEVEM